MPRIAVEGVVFRSFGDGTVDYNDLFGDLNHSEEIVGLSKSQIETMDLLSEGPIRGISSGYYIYSGNIGEIGWQQATFSGYRLAEGLTGVESLRSIYWNEVPVLNNYGKVNYQDVNVAWSEGTQNGKVLQTLSPFQTVSRTIGERVFAGELDSKYYRVLNKDCRGVVVNVKIPSLSFTNLANEGNIERTTVEYKLSYRPIYSNQESSEFLGEKTEKIFGKFSNSQYIRATRLDFLSNLVDSSNFIGWEIKVTRVTDDSSDSFLRNQIFVDSLTEIQGNVYSFPNSSMVRSLFDAEFFSSVPERAFEIEGLKVKVPGNYDPVLRTYSETGFATINSGWNGEFATGKQFTNNPAWCYYDLLTNERYGLGKYVDASYVDKWNLYEIGQYCDTLVSDGFGGLEPRFTANMWLTSREEAYKVVQDMSSVFRGLTYYANGNIFAIQDAPKNPILTFTNANVENGDFTYASSSKKSRHSIAIVRYNEPKDFYKPAVEYIEDFQAIRKYGIKEVEVTAFGCTSRGQALRLGRWILASDNLEPETIKFNAGLEANYLKPGDIFTVFDANRKLKRYGGRTLNVIDINTTGSRVLLDYSTDLEANVQYDISFVTPSYSYDPSQVTGLDTSDTSDIRKSFIQKFPFSGWQAENSGNHTILHIHSGFDYSNYIVTGNSVWTIELSKEYASYTGSRYFTNKDYDYFRVLNIKEEDSNKYSIEGLQYNPEKFGKIESGLLFTEDIGAREKKIPGNPYAFNAYAYSYGVDNNQKAIDYNFMVDDIKNVTDYKVYAKTGDYGNDNLPSNEYLIAELPPKINYGTFVPTRTGEYYFRVYSYNAVDTTLSPSFATGMVPIYGFETIKNVSISALRINDYSGSYTGNAYNRLVTFVEDNDANPTLSWQVGYGSQVNADSGIKYRASVRPYSENNGRIPTEEVLYQETGLTSLEWDFSLAKNISSSGGPHREYQVVVEAHNNEGLTSAGNQIGFTDNSWHAYPNGYDILTIRNPRFTGLQFSNFISESFVTGWENNGDNIQTGVSGVFETISYIGPNGDVTIEITSGQLDADLVGGFMYVSTGQFPLQQAVINTGFEGLQITKNRFDFNPQNSTIYHPTAAKYLTGRLSGYISFSLYDEVDESLLDSNIDVSTGLWISNNSVIHNEANLNNFIFGGEDSQAKVHSISFSGTPPANYTPNFVDNPNCVLLASGEEGDLVTTMWVCDFTYYSPVGT